jgi:O-antigen/teichoic acid export membrane protein
MAPWRINKNLRSDFTWVLWGNVFYSACQWGIVLVLAKLGSPQQVGEYALGLAVSAPILLFANFQLRSLLASDVGNQFTFGEYFQFRLISLGAALLIVVGVSAATRESRDHGMIIFLVGIAQALDLISDTYYGWMQKCGRMDRLSRSLTMKGPLSLAALGTVMYLTGSLAWAVVGLAAGRLIVLLSWDSRVNLAGPVAVTVGTPGSTARLLRLAFPLGLISMLGALSSSIPRWVLQGQRGSAELGIFSAIASLLSAGTLVISAFGQSVFVPAAQAYRASNRTKFREFILLAVAAGAALGGAGIVVAALFGRTILAHLLRPEYGEHADVFVRLMMAGTVTFAASGVGYVITAARSLQPQIPVLAATAVSAALMAVWMIPKQGLMGAADAMLVSAVVQLAGTFAVVAKIDRQLRAAVIPAPSQEPENVESSSVEA